MKFHLFESGNSGPQYRKLKCRQTNKQRNIDKSKVNTHTRTHMHAHIERNDTSNQLD